MFNFPIVEATHKMEDPVNMDLGVHLSPIVRHYYLQRTNGRQTRYSPVPPFRLMTLLFRSSDLTSLELGAGRVQEAIWRIREEKADIHHSYDMDICHDSSLLHLHVLGASLHDWRRHSRTGRIIQRSHCHSQCTQQSQKLEIHTSFELVLPWRRHVLPLRRECDILLQTHRARR